MAKTNTEKPMGQAQKKKEAIVTTPKQKMEKTNVANTEKKQFSIIAFLNFKQISLKSLR